MRISDWSSDVCSSDLQEFRQKMQGAVPAGRNKSRGPHCRGHQKPQNKPRKNTRQAEIVAALFFVAPGLVERQHQANRDNQGGRGQLDDGSGERRVGQDGVSTCRLWLWQVLLKK